MNKTTFSKLEKVIIYIISQLPNNVTRTKLVKLLYLIDVDSFKKNKTSITKLEWISYHYGPYSPKIVEAIDSLNNFEIQEELNTSFDGNVFFLYSLGPNPRLKCNVDKLLNTGEREIVDNVLAEFGNKSLKSLLNAVYETKSYKRTPLGKKISSR